MARGWDRESASRHWAKPAHELTRRSRPRHKTPPTGHTRRFDGTWRGSNGGRAQTAVRFHLPLSPPPRSSRPNQAGGQSRESAPALPWHRPALKPQRVYPGHQPKPDRSAESSAGCAIDRGRRCAAIQTSDYCARMIIQGKASFPIARRPLLPTSPRPPRRCPAGRLPPAAARRVDFQNHRRSGSSCPP